MQLLMLSYGFRPLFLCAVAAALTFIPWWIAVFFGMAPYWGPLPPIAWHGHEVIFGFGGAAIGGFLSTAVPNWTGRAPISGAPLALIVVSWLLARIVFAIDLGLDAPWLLIIDCFYWLSLTILLGREIVLARNYRNLKVIAILAGFMGLTTSFHAETLGLPAEWQRASLRCAVILTSLLITLIGGRIIPAFTGNWLRANRPGNPLPAAFGMIDRVTFVFTGMLVIAWTVKPEHGVTGLIAIVAGIFQLTRLLRWQGHQTIGEPLLFALHAAYVWLGIGFLLIGVGPFVATAGVSTGVHALGAGAMATMIMAVASRAAMGHTGRPLTAGPVLSVSFLLIHLAALTRIGASFDPRLLGWSAALWTLAFIFFAVAVVPTLIRPARS